MNKPVVLDLFCGAGGLSEGFRQAGYHVAAGIEFDPNICLTHDANFPEGVTIQADMTKVTPQEIIEQSGYEYFNVIMGGFPCQGYSHVGKRWIDDPRNQLFKEFVRIVDHFQPEFVVGENVVGIVTMGNGFYVEEIKKEFKAIGYEMEVKILNSAEYGVPQRRYRAFFIGNRVGVPNLFPETTHGEGKKPFVTVGEAIYDLPKLGGAKGLEETIFKPLENRPYQQYMRGDITFEQFLNEEYIEEVKEEYPLINHWTSVSKDKTLERFQHIPMGQNWKALPEHLKTNGKYSNLYLRLDENNTSVTLTNIRKSMFIHPLEDRLLSVREGARIQSFPDYMVFKGTLGSQQQQIGNAVPPLLGYAVGKKIFDYYFAKK